MSPDRAQPAEHLVHVVAEVQASHPTEQLVHTLPVEVSLPMVRGNILAGHTCTAQRGWCACVQRFKSARVGGHSQILGGKRLEATAGIFRGKTTTQ